jgi:hypothetical protein
MSAPYTNKLVWAFSDVEQKTINLSYGATIEIAFAAMSPINQLKFRLPAIRMPYQPAKEYYEKVKHK